MAASVAKIGHGSIVTWNSVPVPEVKQASHNGPNGNPIDVTNMDSPDVYTEFIAGIRDGGEVTLSGNYTAVAGQNALKTDLDSGTKRTGTIALGVTPTATITISGFVTAFSIAAEFGGALSFSASIKVTGKPTIA